MTVVEEEREMDFKNAAITGNKEMVDHEVAEVEAVDEGDVSEGEGDVSDEEPNTEYLIRPLASAEDEVDGSDFEPDENDDEDTDEVDDDDDDDDDSTDEVDDEDVDGGKIEAPSKRKRSSKDDASDDNEDDEKPSKH